STRHRPYYDDEAPSQARSSIVGAMPCARPVALALWRSPCGLVLSLAGIARENLSEILQQRNRMTTSSTVGQIHQLAILVILAKVVDTAWDVIADAPYATTVEGTGAVEGIEDGGNAIVG